MPPLRCGRNILWHRSEKHGIRSQAGHAFAWRRGMSSAHLPPPHDDDTPDPTFSHTKAGLPCTVLLCPEGQNQSTGDTFCNARRDSNPRYRGVEPHRSELRGNRRFPRLPLLQAHPRHTLWQSLAHRRVFTHKRCWCSCKHILPWSAADFTEKKLRTHA